MTWLPSIIGLAIGTWVLIVFVTVAAQVWDDQK